MINCTSMCYDNRNKLLFGANFVKAAKNSIFDFFF